MLALRRFCAGWIFFALFACVVQAADEDVKAPAESGVAAQADGASGDEKTPAEAATPATGKDAAEAAFREGYEAHRRGQMNQALASYTKAIQLDPGHIQAHNNRGLVYQAKRNLNKAIADFDEAIRLSPKLTAAYVNRGTALLGLGEVDKAIADFNQVLKIDPKTYRAYKLRSVAYEIKGDKMKAFADQQEAIKYYKPKYKTAAHDAIALELQVKGKDYVPNYELLEAIIDRVRMSIKPKKSYTEQEALAILQLIDEILVAEHFVVGDQALLCDSLISRQVNQRMLDSMDPRQRRFRLKLNDTIHFSQALAISLIYEAVGEIVKLPIQVALVPGHAFVRWTLPDGTALNWEPAIGSVKSDTEYAVRMRISDKLIKDGVYLAPLTHDEMLAGVLCNIAMVWSGEWFGLENEFREKGEKNVAARIEKAVAAVSKAIEMNKKSYEAYVQRGMYFSRAKENRKAIEDNDRAIELDPNQPSAYFGRGLALLADNDNAKAIDDFTKTIEMNPNLPAAYYFRGVAKAQSKDLEKAIVDFDKATELAPRFADAYQAKARAWEMLGKNDRAMEELKKLKQLQGK
jgi:tetratricopeptide (TPR) repeat protein